MIRNIAIGVLLVAGIMLFGNGAWIQAKAVVAQGLLQMAWSTTQETGEQVKPWPWSDHWPVAELVFNGQNDERFIVLHGDSGAALAFAPGWDALSDRLGSDGTAVISAHRDTHFRILKDSVVGDQITVIGAGNKDHQYEITSIEIVDSSQSKIEKRAGGYLVLITCYPFNAISPGGVMWYVVTAEYSSNSVVM